MIDLTNRPTGLIGVRKNKTINWKYDLRSTKYEFNFEFRIMNSDRRLGRKMLKTPCFSSSRLCVQTIFSRKDAKKKTQSTQSE
jgi:hypothetical protein